MKIAIITGASSGMGREFARQISVCYPWLDEIWLIARREQELEATAMTLHVKARILPLDLLDENDLMRLQELLKNKKPCIKVLVNSAGFGKIGRIGAAGLSSIEEMIRLNCEALTKVTYLSLPYCKKGTHIIQLCSAAAFVPQPYFGIYAATKSYVLSFTRSLKREEAKRGITVTAVCPGPVNTEFFNRAGNSTRLSALKKGTMASPQKVVKKAIQDAARGREFSIYGGIMKGLFVLCKIIPHRILLAVMEHL